MRTFEEIQTAAAKGVADALPGIIELARGEGDPTGNQRLAAVKWLADLAFDEPAEVVIEHGDWIGEVSRITAEFLGDRDRFEEWHRQVMEAIRQLGEVAKLEQKSGSAEADFPG